MASSSGIQIGCGTDTATDAVDEGLKRDGEGSKGIDATLPLPPPPTTAALSWFGNCNFVECKSTLSVWLCWWRGKFGATAGSCGIGRPDNMSRGNSIGNEAAISQHKPVHVQCIVVHAIQARYKRDTSANTSNTARQKPPSTTPQSTNHHTSTLGHSPVSLCL